MAKLDDCRLREMVDNDLEQVLEWRNSERVREQMYKDQIIGLPEHRAWFVRMKGSDTATSYIFELEGEASGVVNYTKIDRDFGRCEWGFYLGRTDLPTGIGTCMGVVALDYAFDRLAIRKVIGEVLDFNQRSQAFHQKLGFQQEGRWKEHVWKNDAFHDVFCFAIFRDEWLAQRKSVIQKLIVRGIIHE